MAKKDKKTLKKNIKSQHIGLETLSFRGLKRKAIALGMPFPDACISDAHKLASYIQKNPGREDDTLINGYDDWMDEQLDLAGYAKDDPMRHYQLRLGYISPEAMANAPKLGSKPKKPKEPKARREKDDSGLWKGTKKAYTYELTKRGFTLDRITRRVLKKFPDANSQSIKQWYKKAVKENK